MTWGGGAIVFLLTTFSSRRYESNRTKLSSPSWPARLGVPSYARHWTSCWVTTRVHTISIQKIGIHRYGHHDLAGCMISLHSRRPSIGQGWFCRNQSDQYAAPLHGEWNGKEKNGKRQRHVKSWFATMSFIIQETQVYFFSRGKLPRNVFLTKSCVSMAATHYISR
jgi:hypothetical protein